MEFKTIEVRSRTDPEMIKTAKLMICECASEVFNVFSIDEHTHFQCDECGNVYCDGTCDGRVH